MSDHSAIEWTDATWNPVTGCSLVSEGCRHCYAARLAATRLSHHPSRTGLARLNAAREAKFTGEVRFNEQWLDQPLRWKRPRRIFVCAHGDLFHESVPDVWIDRVFVVMAKAPQHVFQVLTKRPERALEYLRRAKQRQCELDCSSGFEWLTLPLPNVWLGTSAEDQATADARIPHLLEAPAAVRFVSAEPLLGPVDLNGLRMSGSNNMSALGPGYLFADGPFVDWVIAGGESGAGARPMHPDWVRSLRDQCRAAGVPFFFKQWGAWAPWDDDNWSLPDGVDDVIAHERARVVSGVEFLRVGKKRAGRLLDGREWSEMPEAFL